MAKTKTWAQKMATPAQPEVKPLDKPFGGQPAGARMLIPTPQLVADYVRQLPKGTRADVVAMRQDLAQAHGADFACPLTTGIFLRIVAEASLEAYQQGAPLASLVPFWRVVNVKSPLAKKLSCGPAFVAEQQQAEAL